MLSDLIAHGPRVRMVDLPRARIALHAMPIGAGFETRHNELYSWEGLKRGSAPLLLIQHTLRGRGELDYAGVRHALDPGTTMLVTAPHPHRYWLERGRMWEYFWIGVHGSEALRIGRSVLDLHGPVLRLAPAALDRLADSCLRIIAAEPLEVGEASAAAYDAVTALFDGMAARQGRVDAELPSAVQRALTLIDSDLAAPLGVDRLAGAAGLSRAHFVRLFSQAMQLAPSAYVFQRRLERAARLLHATDVPVAEVARATGFANANYFAKAFRRTYGVSPTEFRDSKELAAAGPAG